MPTTKNALEIIEKSVTIPSLPTIVGKINDLLQDPETSAVDIGKVVASDAPIASKVLRIVNSAHYGLRERVISLEHACAVLGTRVLRNIVMQASVIQQFGSVEDDGDFSLETLWRHSILCAQIAQSAARKCSANLGLTPDEFYTCGLLHDIGMVAALDCLRDEYVAALQACKATGKPLHEVEVDQLGFSHADVGAHIAMRWGLPAGLISAVQYHHGPVDEIEGDPTVGLIALVNEACSLVEREDEDGARALWTEDAGSDLGLSQEDFGGLVDLIVEELPQIEV